MDHKSFEEKRKEFDQRKADLETRKHRGPGGKREPPAGALMIGKAVLAGLLATTVFASRIVSRQPAANAVPAPVEAAPNKPDLENQDNWATADMDIGIIVPALNGFHKGLGHFPTTEEGLKALVDSPEVHKGVWSGPYIIRSLLLDPWGNPYVYRRLGPDSYSLKVEDEPPEIHRFTSDAGDGDR